VESDFLNVIRPYNIRPRFPRPDRAALLVIDMQNVFAPIAEEILTNTLSILRVCRAVGIKAIFTRHGHHDASQNKGMLGEWWRETIVYGDKKWELIGALSPRKDEKIIDKDRYSAFWGTDLEATLKTWRISEVIITGVMTNCCCETTARDAFMRDYRVFFISDATATINDDLHVSSLKNLAYGFAHILSTKQLCRYLIHHQQHSSAPSPQSV
jgi:isochorismate hydrolase